MEKKLNTYILDNHLFTQKDKLLIAVSGGVDSIVLCVLLKKLGYTFDIAHCNFQLRGEESDADETFVHDFAQKIGVNYHVKRFDTEGVVKAEKKSVQEVARDLRYTWFESLRQQFDYQYIATAHHASDAIETMLFNLSRGAGLRGLRGILPKTDTLVRPLLWATKEKIIGYALREKIDFREDSSNLTDKYKRNFIRHHIMPAFQTLTPDFERKATESLQYMQEAQVLLDMYVQKIAAKVTHFMGNQLFIDKNRLKEYPSVSTLLFEILRERGFSSEQVRQILYESSPKTKVGTTFQTPTHKLLIDRLFYIVKPIEKSQAVDSIHSEAREIFHIHSSDAHCNIPNGHLTFDKMSDLQVIKNTNIAQLDYDTLTFPLTLRRWQKGDSFQPLGMNGKTQKLSDFFKNQKLSVFEKSNVWILTTADNSICWIVGYRLDERFKIKEQTKKGYSVFYQADKY